MQLAVVLSLPAYTLVFFVLQSIYGRRYGATNSSRFEPPGSRIMKLIATLFFILAIDNIMSHPLDPLPIIRGLGVIIVIIGLMLSMSAQRHLGKNWVGGAALTTNHQLVTTGPYRYVRHPLYSGILVSVCGIGFFSWNWYYALAGLCLALSFLYRVPLEEHLLRKKFKKKFDRYASTTGWIIPRFRKRG